ncbi:hypothetical protein MKW94_023806 [Papaver nudicaule]|uniref:RRM domain-containing protein n=1 Tax=Papaver nudicaule TaxID=74823 RepID=A0AA42B3J8_PAPNU|nr:hypothetical protein [Papaver nudicaule]
MAPPKNSEKPSNKPGKETESHESHNLWVGNLSNDTTEEDLMDLFGKHGDIDSVTSYSSRNFAFIYYKRVEDAKEAKEALQGTNLLGNPLKIEFARPAKPGKQLWVGAISSAVTKDHLENEFSKFGKIEEFKFLRDRNTALVDYSKSEDAAAALKSMNGKRIGGDQIRVDYLRSQPPRRQQPGGKRGQQPSNVLWIGYPPTIKLDEQMLHNAMILFGEIERIKSFPSRNYSFVEFRSVDEARRAKEGLQGRLFNDPRIQILFSSSGLAPAKDSPGMFPGIKGSRPDMFYNEPSFGPGSMDFYGDGRSMGAKGLMRSLGPQGGFDLSANPELYNDLAGLIQNFSNTRRHSPSGPGLLPSFGKGMRQSSRGGTWDGADDPYQRESKRSRIDGHSPIDDRGVLGPYGQDQNRHSPSLRFPGQGVSESELCWRGVIAKGGTPVCNARCVPIGKGIDSQLPEIVNCSARTGLDLLAKHYAEASGFDIVYFLPDSEEDFASYTEFLRYLGAKNRAGVAKFDDGTTLFLVPPSDFLTKVLDVSGPERLYGVVLKLPQHMPNTTAPVQQQSQPPIPPSPYINRQQLLPSREEQLYNKLSHVDSMSHHQNQVSQHNEGSPLIPSAPQDFSRNSTSLPQSGVSLPPELLATLTSLLPPNFQSSVTNSAQLPMVSSAQRPTSNLISSQGWRQDHPTNVNPREEQSAQQAQQLVHQFGNQPPSSQYHPGYASGSDSLAQDPVLNIPQQQGGVLSRTPSNFANPSQGAHFVPQHVNQHFQFDPSQNSQRSYGGSSHPTNAAAPFRAPGFEQPKLPVTSSTQVQQLQSALSSAGQGSADGDADKNQRYQSTLQFAANLLLQIQQQQQGNSQAAQGPGNHQ